MPIQTVESGVIRGVEPDGNPSQLKHLGSAAEAQVGGKIGCRLLGVVSAVTVTPATISLAAGKTSQLKAVGTDAEGNSYDITSIAVWSTASAAVVTVAPNGIIKAVAAGGPTNVTATYGGFSNSCAVTVT